MTTTTTPMPPGPPPPPAGPAAPGEDELHALVDGLLDPARAAAVMAWLAAHPADAERVAAWQAQRLALRRLARSQDLGDTPAALSAVVQRAAGRQQRRSAWQQALAAGLLLTVGLGSGLGAGQWWARQDAAESRVLARRDSAAAANTAGTATAPPRFVHDAALAHAAYTPEKRHPVEVSAADEAHLVQWLSKRLGAPLKIPTLAPQGYQLLGGRLLPGEGAPRAQFMYEGASGARLTLYVTVFPAGQLAATTGFQTVAQGDQTTFYWVDERFGYALSTPAAAAGDLQTVARAVYAQLDAGGR